MYLKAIEVHGFKSFANKTVFRFHNGVTAIVGPNGSGKSNVADAVRWVLGEQRAKQLRGGSMQDVIFAGTENRKPLGYASVSITLDNADHILPISYDEVTVTRRLYRSGESEYLMNGTQCRLKDIHELFYDTGIGKEGYSIIGQGQIEKILSGKPEERRELFDEAVGIVKFKRRKAEAQKKLENEQANLARVNDILTELRRQKGPLEKQSEKAKIYLKKREELKAYDVNDFLFEYQDLKVRQEETKKTAQQSAEELEGVRSEIEKIRAQYDETVHEVEELDEKIRSLQENINASKLARQQSEGQIALLTEQINSAHKSEQQKQERLSQIDEAITLAKSQSKSLDEARTALEEHTETMRQTDAEASRKYQEILDEAEAVASKLEESKKEVLRILNERSALTARKESLTTLLEQMEIRRSQLQGRILQLHSDASDQSGESERLKGEQERIDREIQELNEESRKADEELQSLQQRLTGENQQMESSQQEYHRLNSRLETLKNIAERYDGYGSSIRKVMERKPQESGLLGVVADLIKTEKRYETAIETALGGSIQNIVTAEEETAKRMISYLKTNRFGRATFLPLTAMRHAQPFTQQKALTRSGVIGLASDLVKADDRYHDLVAYLLGRTVVAENIDAAIALNKAFQYSLRIVTLEGDLLSPGGSMSGGAYKNSSNLLGRRREIEDLEKQIQEKRRELSVLKDSIESDRSNRNALRDLIRNISGQLQQKYLEQNTVKLSLSQVEGGRSELARTVEELAKEKQESEERIASVQKEQQQLEQSLAVSRQAEEAELSLQALDSERAEALRAEELENRENLEKIHVELASFEQKDTYLRKEKIRIQEEMEKLSSEKVLLIGRDNAEELVKEKETAIQKLTMDMETQDVTIEEGAKKVEALREKRHQSSETQKGFFAQREELTERESLLDRECYRLNSQIEKLEETRENRIAYMWEEYELTYSAAQSLKRDDLGSRTEWKKQMAILKREIRELGSVNVNAIEEYKEIAERHDFLEAQHNDLIQAEEALQKIIKQLDEGMRRQFKENFSRIQTEFDKSFKELFGGGKGTLELVDDEDILEAGIRIEAQPPGKKLQNMMQLSGGEKSLTAIALLFAIQNLKPSPFCLLDEIEAALDENNVDRYAGYLHKLTKHTQFIIITHRRGTMAAADRMYGITMQEKGVSALVSVNLVEEELS